MYLEIFLADFAVFRVFFWEFCRISRKYLNFAGPRPRKISEALYISSPKLLLDNCLYFNSRVRHVIFQ